MSSSNKNKSKKSYIKSKSDKEKEKISKKNKIKNSISTDKEEEIKIPEYITINSISKGRIKNYALLSKQGITEEGFQNINQVSCLILPNLYNFKDFNIFFILEGHGHESHFISNFIKKYFSSYFESNPLLNPKNNKNLDYVYYLLQRNNYSLIKEIFQKAEEELKNNKKINSDFSGTSCIMVIQIGEKIICANVGDSRAFMVKTLDRIIPLSFEHWPNLVEESERILKNGGEIYKTEEDYYNEGVFRIWKKGEKYPGIRVSRSIGDNIATKLGVICTPEIIEQYIDKDIRLVIIGTRALFEFLNNKDIMDIIAPFYFKNDPKGACKTIVEIARELYFNKYLYIDDITVCVIFF